ncbi:hypothetical protein TNIN_464381 [Trichonephila inaurata madagascariensis]|uniref:Uncharacterized protein n=1 Tax=Trichonephila inaurata madagascariensis TaxID=2747483 RepID=A0A8X6J7A6_9ARAC|nr:hypothetical protein TNIN_464381 [Trichonephila inaurata madagascariensis]
MEIFSTSNATILLIAVPIQMKVGFVAKSYNIHIKFLFVNRMNDRVHENKCCSMAMGLNADEFEFGKETAVKLEKQFVTQSPS